MARLLTPIGRVIALAMARRTPRVSRLIAHYSAGPRRHELTQAGTWTDQPENALAAQGLAVSAHHREAAGRLLQRLDDRASETRTTYPDYYGAMGATLTMIALICVADRVESVVETGVADGRTSFVLLAALRERHGRVSSIDIADNAGSFVDDRTGWDLHITDGSPTAVREIVKSLGELDLFIHDSDHDYVQQFAELKIGWEALRPGGWLVVDDADWSYACLDFTARTAAKSSFLYNPRNVAMVIRKA